MARFLDRVSTAVGFSFVLAISGVIGGCGGSKADTKTAASEGGGEQLTVGNPAPDLSIQTINGKGKISNDSLKGKIAIVDFWATWCAPCKTSFPKLEELSKKHSGKVEIVGVSVDDEKNGVADFAKENGATFAIGWDEGHSIAERWKVKSMPTTVILDASGTVRHVHAGFHDDEPELIAKELTALLAEPAPASSPKTEVASGSSPSSSPEEKKEDAKKEEDEAPPPAPTAKKGGKKGGGGKKTGGKPAPKKKH
jgi:cytochrome c biogenesis protein CcmG/thiol:disulfide interchange protein DsbE